MSTILDRIVESKRAEITASRLRLGEDQLTRAAASAPPVRDFAAALRRPGLQVIAEVKRASPSAGTLHATVDPVRQAQTYEQGGAACISVLTDGPFFQGSLDDLERVRQAVGAPVLRKDFIVDRYQVLEARAAGADAVLLIAEILDDAQLLGLRGEIETWGMAALVECYEPANLTRVIASGATLIGINNRNLHTFETRLEQTLELATRVPSDRCLISESGIKTRADVERLKAAGVKALLVGETLMKADDPAALLRSWLG